MFGEAHDDMVTMDVQSENASFFLRVILFFFWWSQTNVYLQNYYETSW